MVAAAGYKIFNGTNGRVLEALVEMKQPPSGVTDFTTPGKMAKQIGTHLQHTILSLDPDKLVDLTGAQKKV